MLELYLDGGTTMKTEEILKEVGCRRRTLYGWHERQLIPPPPWSRDALHQPLVARYLLGDRDWPIEMLADARRSALSFLGLGLAFDETLANCLEAEVRAYLILLFKASQGADLSEYCGVFLRWDATGERFDVRVVPAAAVRVAGLGRRKFDTLEILHPGEAFPKSKKPRRRAARG
jgi:hypothetical protein